MKSTPVTLVGFFVLLVASNSFAQNLTILHAFPKTPDGSDGIAPQAGLTLSGQTLYGTTTAGGTNDYGTVFSVNTDGSNYRLLHQFNPIHEGEAPLGLAVVGNRIYGAALAAGGNPPYGDGFGALFALNTDGSGFTVLHAFTNMANPAEPGNPQGLIVQGGTIFGTTPAGGSGGNGVVYSMDTNGANFTVLHAFTPGDAYERNADGREPLGGLILCGEVLYGTALLGGAYNDGTIYSVDTNGANFTVLHTFGGDGVQPYSALVLIGQTLYGTTAYGGGANFGTVFCIDTNGSNFKVLHSFDPSSDGAWPEMTLTCRGNTLFGTTGISSDFPGTIFSLQSDGSAFTLLHVLDTNLWQGPYGPLVLTKDTLYGTVSGLVFGLTLDRISGISKNADGSATLRFNGVPFDSYVVQAADNLVSPSGWQPIATNVAGADGSWTFMDTNASSLPRRFYRSVNLQPAH